MVQEYFQEDFISPYRKGYKLKLAIFFIFLVIFGLLIFFAFFDKLSFIGNVIRGNINDSKLNFGAELTGVPFIELDGEFNSVNIEGISDALFYAGDQKFSLENFSNSVILTNYKGKIYFNENNVSNFRGKAEEIIINGVLFKPKLGSTTKVYFQKEFNYDFLEVKETAFIKKLLYNTSGEISLYNGKNLFQIYDEEVLISRFQGDLKVDNERFILQGYIGKLEIIGKSEISVGV